MDNPTYRRIKEKIARYERLHLLLEELNRALDILKRITTGDTSKRRPVSSISFSIASHSPIEFAFPECTASDIRDYWVHDYDVTTALMSAIQKTKERVVKELDEL